MWLAEYQRLEDERSVPPCGHYVARLMKEWFLPQMSHGLKTCVFKFKIAVAMNFGTPENGELVRWICDCMIIVYRVLVGVQRTLPHVQWKRLRTMADWEEVQNKL